MDLRDYFKKVIEWGLDEGKDVFSMQVEPEKHLDVFFNSINMGRIYDAYFDEIEEIIEVEELEADINNYKEAVIAVWEWLYTDLIGNI
jgi:hypothetical protein